MRSAGTDRREAWRRAGSAQRNVPKCISIFRDNIQTYVARPDTNNMFDTAFVHPESRRFIFPGNDSSLAVFGLDSNGVWVKGADPTKEDQQWSIGIAPVRMPFNGGNVQAGQGFSLAEEGTVKLIYREEKFLD